MHIYRYIFIFGCVLFYARIIYVFTRMYSCVYRQNSSHNHKIFFHSRMLVRISRNVSVFPSASFQVLKLQRRKKLPNVLNTVERCALRRFYTWLIIWKLCCYLGFVPISSMLFFRRASYFGNWQFFESLYFRCFRVTGIFQNIFRFIFFSGRIVFWKIFNTAPG